MNPHARSEPGRQPALRDPFSTREAMLSWVRDIAPYGIFTTDAQLVIRDWNEWLAAHSGYSAEDVVGRPLLEIFPDLAERHLDEHFTRALKGEVAVLATALHKYLLPFPNPVRDYSLQHMLQTARIAPLPADNEIVGTITIIEDVTQRERHASVLRRQQEYDRLLSNTLALLIKSERPLQTIADIFPHIAASLKLDVYLSYLFNTERRELQLQGAGGVTPEARRALATAGLSASLCGQVARQRAPVIEAKVHLNTSSIAESIRKLGLRSYAGFPLLIGDRILGTLSFGSYARDSFASDEIEFLGKLAQYVSISLDRSQREAALHDAQERLSQHAGELEIKIAERTARLHETIAQLESFSYTIAHDLRAPIRALNGYAEILLQDLGATIPSEGKDLLYRLQRATRRLDALTRDLLRFSRVVREDVRLMPVTLDDVVADAIADIPSPHSRAVTVVPPLGSVLAHRTLLQQCVANLFDNALKFATPGVPPQIVVRTERRSHAATSSSATAQGSVPGASGIGPMISSTYPGGVRGEGPRVRVWVEDNGIGIPAVAQTKIWGVFERLPEATKVEGTGIGLAIVARAIQQMGGACGVESEPGHGARFWMEFAAA